MRKILVWFRYLLLLVMSYVFAYLFNLNENYILLYMLLLVPIADFIYFILVKNKCEVQIISEKEVITRGEENKYSLIIENKGNITIPFVDYSVNINNKFSSNKTISKRVAVDSSKSFINTFFLTSEHIGLANIIVPQIGVSSIFGFFDKRYQINKEINTTILPDYKEISNIYQALEIGGGLDLEDEVNRSAFQGEPGYEYKDYIEGDPLNRVNWKLSSKQNKLMIRKSISGSRLTKSILLDYGVEDNKEMLDSIDLITETYLSLVLALVKREYEVEVILKNEAYKEVYMENEQDVEEMRIELGKYKFSTNNEERFADIDVDKLMASDFIVVTIKKDECLRRFVNRLEEKGIEVLVISNDCKKIFEREAYISDTYVLERI